MSRGAYFRHFFYFGKVLVFVYLEKRNNMKNSLRKISLVLVVAFIGLFITSCDGTTRIYGLEKTGKHNKHNKHKKYNKNYDYYYGNHHNLPPGQHKKIHGDKSAKKYAPGQNKKYKKAKKHKKH